MLCPNRRLPNARVEQSIHVQRSNCLYKCPMVSSTVAGSSAARLARSVRDAEVGGSNPLSPTAPGVAPRRSRFSFWFPDSLAMSNVDQSSSGDAIAEAPHGESGSNADGERLRAIPPV